VNRGPFKDALVGKKGGENKDSSTLKDDDDLELLDRDIITGEEDDMPSIQFFDHSDYFLVKFQSIEDYIEALIEGLDLNNPEDVALVERNLGTGMESDLQRHQQMGSANQILKKPPNILKNKGRNFKVPGLFKVPISEAMNRIVDSLKSTLAIEDLMELMEIDGIKATSDDL
ncbi:hypothetical protein Golob_001256, partial [Gossypium lobatum]|nr:hypothetical protein [Gossypium lobatum]